MRRSAALIVAFLGVLLSGVLQLAAQEQVAILTILQVVETDPLRGEEVGLNESITLFFNRELDCASTEGALQIFPPVPGSTECQGSRLKFTPDGTYERGTTYTLTLRDTVRSRDGIRLAETYETDFVTTGFLEVSETFPVDLRDTDGVVQTDTTITVIFNRPVVPLVTIEDMANLPQPLSIEPAVEGTGEWLNTSIYIFTPAESLLGGTDYLVTVNEGLTAVDGSVLVEPYTFGFRTPPPEVVGFSPGSDRNDVGLNTKIQVTFNQPMNTASVEDAFIFQEIAGAVLSGTFEWNETDTGFGFTPDNRLTLATSYSVRIGAGAQSAASTADLIGDNFWTFTTVPYPDIIGTDPRNGESDAAPYGGINIYFASPMNPETLQDKITIVPEPAREPSYYYQDWDEAYSVSFSKEPGTTYTVTIAPGMEDIYGNKIEEGYSFSFTTDDYSPDLMVRVPGSIGFYNAYRAPTQLFLTHRNVSRIDLELYEVDFTEFAERLSTRNYYDIAEDYTPSSANLLNAWSIPSVAPRNTLRYELIQPGNVYDACPGALPPRVKVGDKVVVINEPDSLRARQQPTTASDIVELLYKDDELTIIGGPICTENRLLWWQVGLQDGREAWVVESFDAEYMLDILEPAAVSDVTISADGSGGALAPGVYFLRVDAPETSEYYYSNYGHFMVVSTAVLTMKSTIDSVTVWATDVQSGQPLVNVPIDIYDDANNRIASGRTDEDGLLQVSVPRIADLYEARTAILNNGTHFGLAFSDWTNGIEPYVFDQDYTFYPYRYRVYAYTDRPLYRPGQPVYFRGVVREKDDMRYTVPTLRRVPVQIYDDQGNIVLERDFELTSFGTFSGEFTLSDDAPLGYYYISVDLPSNHPYQTEGGGVSFGVAEYRLPEFQVNVAPVEPEVVQGGTVQVAVESKYFFGGSVSDAIVDYNVIANPYYFRYDGDKFYDFRDYNYDDGPWEYYGDGYSGEVASGTTTTDSAGMVTIELPAELKDSNQSQIFTIEAVVRDETQNAVAGRTTVVVHQGLIYAGIRPERYVGKANSPVGFEIITVDWDSKGVGNQEVNIEVVQRVWSSVQELDESTGRTTWTYSVEEIPVTDGSITTDANGEALFTFTPTKGGVYKALITTRDTDGNEVKSSTTMWVSSREYVSWRQQNSNRIDMIADKQDYNVGDTAELLITSPFQGTAEALITVERGDVLKIEHVTLESNSFVYQLPIEADYAPNIYVSVYIVKGVDENNPVAGFRMGYINLSVDISQKELNIEVTSDTDRAQPQTIVNYTLEVTDYKGDPVQAEIGVGVTDLAALSLAGPNSQPLLQYFFNQQSLAVRTSTPLTINTDQLTQEVLDTVKGGGGGLAVDGLVEIRGEFIDTPYWNGALVTDENGVATFEVKLPDNLTTWRLDARAITSSEDGTLLVGQDTFDLLSTKPLIIRPVTPRFFIVGDKVILAAVVNNNTTAEQTVVVSLNQTGFTLNSDAAQTITVPADGRGRVEWEVIVKDVATVTVSFTAQAGEFSDGSISGVSMDDAGTLPVYKYQVPETVGTAGVLRDNEGRLESILLPQRYEVTDGELTIKLEQSLAAATVDGLEYLQNFPHQCIEQTVSRFLPNIMTFRALDDLGLADATLQLNLDSAVNFALQKLYAEQKSDGGWGWFINDVSNELTTAYALIGLTVAKEEGFAVSDSVISQAQQFLRARFIVPNVNQSLWRLNRHAFVLYALARSGDGDVGRTVALYNERDRLSLYSKAFLAQALALINPDDQERLDVLLNELVSEAVLSATGVHWDEVTSDYYNWNTNTRTTAIVLDTLIKLRPDSQLLPDAVRYLMVQRRADAWETTQETAWAVMALTDWMVVSGELQPDYTYRVTLNDEAVTEGEASETTVRDVQELRIDVADLLKDEANNLLFERIGDNGALYYTAHLEAYLPVAEVNAVNRGISVERRYYRSGEETPITQAQVGEVVEVRLTIVVPNSRHYVVIEDWLPAGAEAINPQLQTGQQIGTRPELNRVNPLSRGWGWWWFSNIEFRDEKVVLYSTYLPAGTYEYVYTMRPSVAGEYNVIPATGQEFYFPEVYGRSDGMMFTITNG